MSKNPMVLSLPEMAWFVAVATGVSPTAASIPGSETSALTEIESRSPAGSVLAAQMRMLRDAGSSNYASRALLVLVALPTR